jgi:hypothetical protein
LAKKIQWINISSLFRNCAGIKIIIAAVDEYNLSICECFGPLGIFLFVDGKAPKVSWDFFLYTAISITRHDAATIGASMANVLHILVYIVHTSEFRAGLLGFSRALILVRLRIDMLVDESRAANGFHAAFVAHNGAGII